MSIRGTSYLSGLWPPFAQAVRYLLAYCDYYSVDVTLTSGLRSMQEQAELYAKGRSPAEIAQGISKRGQGGAVTDARPGQSAHNYGLAVDIDSPQLAAVMDLARMLGFGTVSWDPDHIEWPDWRSLL